MAVTTALSIVVPNGATLGTTSGITHKLWVVLFNNAGSPSLGIINCRTSQAIAPLNEAALISPTQISAGAATAGVFYSTSSGIVNKTFRILGYLEISEATAGTWAAGAIRVQLFGPTIPLPGNVIQRLFGQISSATSITGPNVQTALNATINIQSAASFIHVQVIGGNVGLANSGNVALFLSRGAGPTGFGSVANVVEPAIGGGSWGFSLSGMDLPGNTGNQAYFLYGSSSVGTNTFNINTTLQTIEVTEIAT
jgi:hypothetical protein